MSTQTTRPGENEQVDDELRHILDEHVAAADLDKETFSRQQILRDGIAKLKHPAPQ